MTRKQKMYPESNRVKMSLIQAEIVDNLVQKGRSEARADVSSPLNPDELSAVPSEPCGELYEWTSKQLIMQFGNDCKNCSD